MRNEIENIITTNRFGGTANLDPRCKLLLLIAVGMVNYFLSGDVVSLSLMIVFCTFIIAGRGGKWAIKMLISYVVVAYLNALLRYISVPGLSVIMLVFGVTILKMIPIIMIGRWIIITTHMDDLMVSLQRMKMPNSVIIPFVVMFRYIPTLGIEYRMIKNAMSLRGISDTFLKRLLHPLATIEYILIPLLMRCLKVTDELAASGSTRGLERDVKRYSLSEVGFTSKEYAVSIMALLFLGGLLFADHTPIGEIILWRV
jgi:energy-coupling factor transporter transmembrane protein EcfT